MSLEVEGTWSEAAIIVPRRNRRGLVSLDYGNEVEVLIEEYPEPDRALRLSLDEWDQVVAHIAAKRAEREASR